jgi:hypothetical protein
MSRATSADRVSPAQMHLFKATPSMGCPSWCVRDITIALSLFAEGLSINLDATEGKNR